MTQTDHMGVGQIKKPTRFMTNAIKMAERLNKRCQKKCRHIELIGGKASAAQVYPDELCIEVIRGLRDQMEVDGRLLNTGIGCVLAVEEGETEIMF